MISVILPSYRNPGYLDLCIQSIVENWVEPQEVMVILDGYVEESIHIREKWKHELSVRFLMLQENQGMQYAINLGVMQATNEWIFVINDDNVFPQEWDKRLLPLLTTNNVYTVNQIEPTGPGMFHFPVKNCGLNLEEFDRVKFEEVERELAHNTESLNGGRIFPFVMEKWWFMAAGGFDTFYQSPNICDWDFFLKLEMNPLLEFWRIHTLALYHFGSVVTKKNAEADMFNKRQQYAAQQYQYKWGIAPSNIPGTNSKMTGDNARGLRLHPKKL